ncbi:hypothetical protein [Novosphingobium terrae]|uniref:hypothetical protein n=1 Tax=Novosphingobium terrae TaxID=2726189 RepID=UPI001F149543|nr:hypothetical protein [Novosphingobium terrae]
MLTAITLLAALAAAPATPVAATPAPDTSDTITTPVAPAETATQKDVAALPEAPVAPGAATDSTQKAKLKFGVGIRGRYDLRFNDVGGNGQRRTSSHLSFDTLALTADYDSEHFFGAAQYRFYGGSFIYGKASGYQNYPGEVNYLMYGYAGAKLSKKDTVTVGVQAVPFDEQYWGSSLLDDLGFVLGMEETYDLGVKYAHKGDRQQFQLGFFPSSGPDGMGISLDGSRYSTNIARADSYVPNGSQNDERNMVIGSARTTLINPAGKGGFKLDAMGSAWISTIHNYETNRNGSKHLFAASLIATKGAWHAKTLVARQDINPRNPGRNDMITVGGFDASYNIATHGTYVFAEIGRDIDTGKFPLNVEPYLNYGKFIKDAAGFQDSERFDLGAVWTSKHSKHVKVFSELLIGRNDPYVGAGQFISGGAQGGDNRYKVSFMLVAGYYF